LNGISGDLSRDYLKTDETEFGMTQSAQRRIVIDNNTTSIKQNYEIALGGGPFFSTDSTVIPHSPMTSEDQEIGNPVAFASVAWHVAQSPV
jgi:hypothetical protein